MYIDQSPKWAAIFAEHPPLAILPPEYLPHLDGGAGAPHFLFGWAFDRSRFLDIARRRRLTFDVEPCYRRRLDSSDTFNFGDLTEDHLSKPKLVEYLHNAAFVFLYSYILQQTHAQFTIRPMLSSRWKSMFALWTNYDIKEKYSTFKVLTKWPKVKKFMNEILNEGLPPGSERSEPLWYWSVDNNFVSSLFLRVSGHFLTCTLLQVRP